MQYMSRSPIQQPLKVSQKVNKNNPTLNSSYLRNIKKSAANINLNISQNQKHRSINQNFSRCKTPSLSKPQKTNDRKAKEIKHFQSVTLTNQNQNSMDQLLNSSINQLQKLMSLPSSNESLEEQNSRLKMRVSKMKSIIKEKLETALKKQKQQVSKMLQDYISLITKLLQDKQELSLKIEQLGNENKMKLKQLDQQWSKKCQAVIQDRDEQLMGTRAQIQQLVGIIENYKQQSSQDQHMLNQMNERIEELQRLRAKQIQKSNEKKSEKSNQVNLEVKVEQQNKKIQALIKLLEKSEMQIYSLKIQIDKYRQEKISRISVNESEIIERYQRQIQQIEQQHYEEFTEYEKAIKETLTNKDEYIEKLHGKIESLRSRKNQN